MPALPLSSEWWCVTYTLESESTFYIPETKYMPRGVPNKQASNGKAIGITEAVRKALAQLGRDAKPTEIREWIQSTFKMDVSPNSISALKTQLNKKAAIKKVKQPTLKEAGISKLEGVRRALAKLGGDVKPQEIQPFLKGNFGIEMTTGLISNYKSALSRKAARKSVLIRTPAATMAASANGSAFTLQDIEAVRQVMAEIGAEKVQQLAAVLAK
jgi:hypothetical protein